MFKPKNKRLPLNCDTKKGYATSRLAGMALNTIITNSTRDVVVCRKYHCEVCGKWHLTSKPDKK